MAKKKILSVGFLFPGGGEVQQVNYQSDHTLLDGDIIVFQPTIQPYSIQEWYQGKPLLYDSASFEAKEVLAHWKSELRAAFEAGKVVFIFLAKPVDVFAHTGEKQYSGTGRNRQTTNIVRPLSSYSALPFDITVNSAKGTSMMLSSEATYLTSYWKEFGGSSPYEVTIDGKFSNIILKTKNGERIVGAIIRGNRGAFVLLPPIEYDEEAFTKYESDEAFWNDDAKKFGKRVIAALVGVADAIQSTSAVTPPPPWTQSSEFRLEQEAALETAISEKSKEIQALHDLKLKLENDLRESGGLRRLLYETGHQLEEAILESLRLFGFTVQRFDDGKSEFDAVFTSSEGRFLGETEGREKQAINIDKLSQLERNIQEDFAKEGVTEYAKGVLFGNPYRLTIITERPAPFTEKCMAGAQRSGIALVFTPDLFAPAKYLKEHEDIEYSRQCREAILKYSGQIVKFPQPAIVSEIITELDSSNHTNEVANS